MNENVPKRRVPSLAMYLPLSAVMWVSRLYVAPSLPIAVPAWKASAENPRKSVIVLGSRSKPFSVLCENGRVTAGSPGCQPCITKPLGSALPPGIGLGGTTARPPPPCPPPQAGPLTGPASDPVTPAVARAAVWTNLRRLSVDAL
jgi:hypothetical protein